MEPWWGAVDALDGALIELEIVADGFLPQMVRNVMALIIEVGRGAKPLDWVAEVISARDRRVGVATAPAHGLTLWRIGYSPFVATRTGAGSIST
jgi:tRNA pseudouridine38-40 synthase